MYKSCKGRSDRFHSRTEKDLLMNFLSHLKFLQPDCTFEWYHAASSFQRHNRTASLCDTCHLVSVRHIRQLKVKFILRIYETFDLKWPPKRFFVQIERSWTIDEIVGSEKWTLSCLNRTLFCLKWSPNDSKRPRDPKMVDIIYDRRG